MSRGVLQRTGLCPPWSGPCAWSPNFDMVHMPKSAQTTSHGCHGAGWHKTGVSGRVGWSNSNKNNNVARPTMVKSSRKNRAKTGHEWGTVPVTSEHHNRSQITDHRKKTKMLANQSVFNATLGHWAPCPVTRTCPGTPVPCRPCSSPAARRAWCLGTGLCGGRPAALPPSPSPACRRA